MICNKRIFLNMKFVWQFTIAVTVLLFPGERLIAQNASIIEKEADFNTYMFSDPNPTPQFGKIFPYFRFDGYSNSGIIRKWKVVEMENDYIKLWILPEIGGKIWGAVEKSTGKEFIYYNHVVKFRDVALRGPWTSGGIEMNFGIIGHAPTTSSPVDYMIRKNDNGSVSCFVGAIDLCSRTRWSVEINLPADKAYFTTRSRWENPTSLDQSYYNWMNMGIKTDGNLEYVFPGNQYLGHDGKYFPWPYDEKGDTLSYYNKNNFGGSKSYHVFGEATGFYGAFWHDDNFGFAHFSQYDEKPGKKIWIWGLSDQGMIWKDLLTDTDGQYSEIQSGRLFNQAAQNSSFTPFKNRDFTPGSTDEWLEYWFPVKGTQGLKYAVTEGSVNLSRDANRASLWFCPNEKATGKLQVRNGKETIFSKEFTFNPMQIVTESINYGGDIKNLSVWLDDKLLYDADSKKYQIKRPVESPSSFSWETAFGHYLKGKELERQRLYTNAEAEYQKALEIEPWYVPALTGMANLSYRETDYNASLEYSIKALSIDTYNAEANMIYGLSGLATGDTASAIDGFSIASADISFRTAAYNVLASISLNRGDCRGALDYAEKSLNYNMLSSEAVQLKILCLRKLGMAKEAGIELSELAEKDPLDHFTGFERFLSDPSAENKKNVQCQITNELPCETYLEYALWYFRNGQISDALRVLGLSPENPVVLIWEGYLNHLSGNEKLATDALSIALKLSPLLVFPFRAETLKPLEWALTVSDDWKIEYYAGLIYLNAGAVEKGKSVWKSLGDKPDFWPFYVARSGIWDEGSSQSRTDIEKALSLSGNEWRAGLYAARFYLSIEDTQNAEKIAGSYYLKFPQNYYLGLQYAKILEQKKNYTDCISLLKKIQVLPNEGASEGRIIWRNANIGEALDLMDSGKFRKAIENIDMALQWPLNLGVGKPYLVDERLENFIMLQCYKKLQDNKSVSRMQQKILSSSEPANLTSDQNDFISAWVLRETGNESSADRIMKELLEKNSLSNIIKWCSLIYSNDLYGSKKLEKEIDTRASVIQFLIRLFNEPDSIKTK